MITLLLHLASFLGWVHQNCKILTWHCFIVHAKYLIGCRELSDDRGAVFTVMYLVNSWVPFRVLVLIANLDWYKNFCRITPMWNQVVRILFLEWSYLTSYMYMHSFVKTIMVIELKSVMTSPELFVITEFDCTYLE